MYYYKIGEKISGPHSIADLRTLGLSFNILIKKEGEEYWKPLMHIPEVFRAFLSKPMTKDAPSRSGLTGV